MNKYDIEGILVLSDILPLSTADELLNIWENFKDSTFNEAQYDLFTCLLRYVSFLIERSMDK